MKKTLYNRKYFNKRDSLDFKIAVCIKNLAKETKSKKILDVGCGTGKLVVYLNKNRLKALGCDPFSIKKNTKIFKKAPATKLPFKHESFDMVTNVSVIEHLTKPQSIKFLKEASRVLKSGGLIFLVTPNYDSIWRKIQGKSWFGYTDPTHIEFYTPRTLAKLLQSQGFKNIKFSFKADNVNFLWYLLISTPLWRLRNSFYISAEK